MVGAVPSIDPTVQTALSQLRSDAIADQDAAFQTLTTTSDTPVAWAYEIWDDMVALLTDKSNRRRAIAAQVLCNLAKSDPEGRMRQNLPALLQVTKDERFVTARHCLQSLWKVGVVSADSCRQLAEGLALRFAECAAEKNGTLIRYDITELFGRLFDETADKELRALSLRLIETETDLKYRKKYAAVWRTR
jgi:hypothetical protein